MIYSIGTERKENQYPKHPTRERECMEKVIHIVRTNEARSDVTYWRTQSHEQRLATLESIRQEYIAWKYDHQPRFQRVYRIVKHT